MARNCDGRPVWEPPIFDYSDLIDGEFDKKRQAALKLTKGDIVRTTAIMDLHAESLTLGEVPRLGEGSAGCDETT